MTRNSPGGPIVPEVGVIGMVPEAWGNVWMPRHQLMTRLARYFHVVWMNPAKGWRANWLDRRSGNSRPSTAGSDVPGFHLHEPHRMLSEFYRPRALVRITRSLRLRSAVRRLRALGAREIVIYVWRPEFEYALDMLPDALSCYHVDDEYTFSTVEQPNGPNEVRLLRRANRVIIHSRGLWEKKAGLASRPEMVPNGVDFLAFATEVPEPDDLRIVPRPRIGYLGVIKPFLDVPLFLALARRHAEWSFVLVGPVRPMGRHEEAFRQLKELPNVYLLGHKTIDLFPAYAQHVDVGIMPYELNEYTKFIYPLKLHEYLAAGLPVVGTPILTLTDFGSVISLATGVDEWSDALGRAVTPEESTPERITARHKIACRHDWNAIAHRVATILAEDLTPEVREAVAAAAPPPVGPCAENVSLR